MARVRVEDAEERERLVTAAPARDVAHEEVDEGAVPVGAEPRGIAPSDLCRCTEEIAVVEMMVVQARRRAIARGVADQRPPPRLVEERATGRRIRGIETRVEPRFEPGAE